MGLTDEDTEAPRDRTQLRPVQLQPPPQDPQDAAQSWPETVESRGAAGRVPGPGTPGKAGGVPRPPSNPLESRCRERSRDVAPPRPTAQARASELLPVTGTFAEGIREAVNSGRVIRHE